LILPKIFQELTDSNFNFDKTSLSHYSSGQSGSIYTLQKGNSKLLAKVFNQNDGPLRMSSEVEGLQLLKSTKTVNIPEIILAKNLPSGSIFIMEFISGNQHNRKGAMPYLGRQLATMHQVRNTEKFGLYRNNYIGSLKQINTWNNLWPEFYFNNRLKPQIDMAVNQGLLPNDTIGNPENWIATIGNIYPDEPPSLTHGDLWAGNMIANHDSTPYLIDPAISYSHREMDLAMSRLFGGYTDEFYFSYNKVYPLVPGFNERVELSQLYYLLVHVNLFGKSYVSQTRTLLRQYFG
jgi:protein-ribulosamine 3-kinase